MFRRLCVLQWLLSAVVLSTGSVYGQDYPNKPIRIVTLGLGGGSDFTSRLIAQGISGPLGQQVIVDNRAGVVISGEVVSKSPPDGYTLLLTGSSFWVGPLLQNMPYDAVKEFTPITLTNRQPNILVVHPSLPVKTAGDLVKLAKARPGELNYSSGGTGSSSQLAAELFKHMAGVNILRISYKVGSQEITEVINGQVQLTFGTAATVGAHVKTGRVRALAVTSAEPSPLLPGLPTIAATGVPGYESVGMTGMFAPAKTPAAIINRLNQEVVRVLNQPDVKEKFVKTGVETVGTTPEQLGAIMKSEITRMGKVIKDAGIRTE